VIEKPKRIIERTDHSSGLYQAAFDRVIGQDDVHIILDVAAGDSPFAVEVSRHTDKRVIRVDRDYARRAPEGDDWLAEDATDLSFEDDSVDVAISAFMMQHLTPEEQQKVLTEMLRVVRPYTDGAVGVVGLFPVYKPSKLEDTLKKAGLSDKVAMSTDYEAFERLSIAEKKLEQPTLWIPNLSGMSDADKRALVGSIVESGAFYRRTTLADLARRAMIARTGDATVHLR